LCIVATLRPAILYKTMKSFYDKIKYDFEKINFVVNIDMVPIDWDSRGFINMMLDSLYADRKDSLLLHNFHITYGEGNFAKAVKTVWENTTSEYVFHLEDDWEFIREIDLNKCIEKMGNEDFDYMRFPKINAPHFNCLPKVALQPSLWRGSVVRELSKHMAINKDPEKQLRTGQGNEELDRILFKTQNKGLIDYGKDCCEDHGRKWCDEHGFKKWNKNNKDVTWAKQ